jgi:hypothetical protein
MRAVRRVFVVGALAALVVAVLPSAGAQTPTVTSVIGSADGLFVDLVVDIDFPVVEPLTFGPEPTVTLPSTGGSVSEEVLSVNESVGLISLTAGLLTASAQGSLGPAGNASAESTVADLALGEPVDAVGAQQLEDPIIAAELISASCAADLTGVSGTTTLVGATVLGETLAVEPPPNTQFVIAVNGFSVGVTLNRQVQNPDGSLSVTAVLLEIDVAGLVTGTLEIGPATCGVVEGLIPAPPAPPQPVPAQVRFTG